MRLSRRKIIISAVGAGLLVAWLAWLPAVPLKASILRVEPSRIFDERGAEFWLVTISLTNRAQRAVRVDWERTRIDAKISGHWIESAERLSANWLLPGRSHATVFLLPADAEACRLHLTYSFEPQHWTRRFTEWTWRKFPKLYQNSRLNRELSRLYYSSLTNEPPPPRWHRMPVRELELAPHADPGWCANGLR